MCRKGFEGIEMAFQFDIDTPLQLFQFQLWLVHCHPPELRQSPWKRKKIFICGLQGDDLAQTVLQICPRKIRFTPRPMKLKYFGGCLTFFSRHHPFLPIVRTVLRCFFCVFHFLLLLRRKCILEKMWLEMGSTSLTTKLKKDIKFCYTHWGKQDYFGNKFRIFEFSRQKGILLH